MTRGVCGAYWLFPSLLDDLNLLKELEVGYLLYSQLQGLGKTWKWRCACI